MAKKFLPHLLSTCVLDSKTTHSACAHPSSFFSDIYKPLKRNKALMMLIIKALASFE